VGRFRRCGLRGLLPSPSGRSTCFTAEMGLAVDWSAEPIVASAEADEGSGVWLAGAAGVLTVGLLGQQVLDRQRRRRESEEESGRSERAKPLAPDDGRAIDDVFSQFDWEDGLVAEAGADSASEEGDSASANEVSSSAQDDSMRPAGAAQQMSTNRPARRGLLSRLGALWLVLCLLVSGGMALRGLVCGAKVGEAYPRPAQASVVAASDRATGLQADGFRLKGIAEFQPGDTVLSWDPETGRVQKRRVVRTVRRVSDHLRVLTFADRGGQRQTIETTNEHPFFVVDRGEYIEAQDLQVGQKVRGPTGELLWLVSTAYQAHPEGVRVYKLEVEGNHNYFVAPLGSRAPPVLAHNNNQCFAGRELSHLKYTRGAGEHLTEVVKHGRFKGELSRPYMRSILTVREIMSAGEPVVEASGALRWNVPGAFRGSRGMWELVIDPTTETILHFVFKSTP